VTQNYLKPYQRIALITLIKKIRLKDVSLKICLGLEFVESALFGDKHKTSIKVFLCAIGVLCG